MKATLTALALAMAGLTGTSAAAQDQITFSGQEAAALKCAHMFTFTSVTMYQAGYIARRHSDMMLTWSYVILNRYVSGTMDQRLAAMEIIGQRHGFQGTLEDFSTEAETCVRQFPVA